MVVRLLAREVLQEERHEAAKHRMAPPGLGQHNLPALRGGQSFGRARGSEILVAVRDSPGSFHDPRHENFWPDN